MTTSSDIPTDILKKGVGILFGIVLSIVAWAAMLAHSENRDRMREIQVLQHEVFTESDALAMNSRNDEADRRQDERIGRVSDAVVELRSRLRGRDADAAPRHGRGLG